MIKNKFKLYENLSITNKNINNHFLKNLKKILKSGSYINGYYVKKFEDNFSKFIGVRYSIGVSNGLDGLTLALNAIKKIRKKNNLNEVLVPANTYIASILSIINSNLKPILIEPNFEDYNINLDLAKKYVTKNTLAIMPVHLYGRPVEYKKLKYFKNKKIFIIEDSSQAHGASVDGKKVGSFGDVGVFSCYPGKNLGALGDAGVITTNSKKIYNLICSLRNYGSKKKYFNEHIGFNNRLDEIQAAFLIEKLKKLNSINSKRIKLAKIYNKFLNSKFLKPKLDSNKNVFHIYPIRVNNRLKFIKYLNKNSIPYNIHYPIPPHKQIALRNIFKNKKFPITEKIHKNIISLPIASYYSEKQIMKFISIMNKFYD